METTTAQEPFVTSKILSFRVHITASETLESQSNKASSAMAGNSCAAVTVDTRLTERITGDNK